jgi:hypothetical protein
MTNPHPIRYVDRQNPLTSDRSHGQSNPQCYRISTSGASLRRPAALTNERNETDIQRWRMDATVLLIKALGEGWNASNLHKL